MSAKDRLKRHEEKFNRAVTNGVRAVLEDSDGRAFIADLLRRSLEAEGKGGAQLRAFGRDLQRAVEMANWAGAQAMRDEWMRPSGGARAEDGDAEQGDEDQQGYE